jgi:hypothetical protein
LQPDPTLADSVLAGFNQVPPWRHVLGFGWLGPAMARWRRDLRDTLAQPG